MEGACGWVGVHGVSPIEAAMGRVAQCANKLKKWNWNDAGYIQRRLEKLKGVLNDCKSKGPSEINLEVVA